jgi:hypothetical protein
MSRARLFLLSLALLGGTVLTRTADGQVQLGNQLPNARLSTLSPCGGQAGATFEVTFTGTDLDLPEALVFSHPGITAKPGEPEVVKDDPKKKGGKAEPQVARFHVTIDKMVPVGCYDARIVGKHGISNARTFVVGDLTEVMEKEPNNDVDQAQRVEINSTINGTIGNPVDVDYYVFAGKKGQRVLLQCQCATIDSKLNPEIKVLDPDGREIAAHRAAPLADGFVDVTLSVDGDYKVRLVQFAHQIGGPDLFYRLSITTGPWIDAVFPPTVAPGKTAKVTLYGRNLPGGKLDPNIVVGGKALEVLTVSVTAPKDPAALQRVNFGGHLPPQVATLDGFEYRFKKGKMSSNPVLLSYATAPVVLEKEPNDTPETAQEVAVPCEIAGRIDKKQDRDWYSFTAKKGDTLIIEILSQRLGAPTDLYATVRNATGKSPVDMVQLDDNVETLSPTHFLTSSRDPAPYKFVAPADGKYQLMIGSHLSGTLADVQHVYTVRIRPEKPDFRLFVMPTDSSRPDSCALGAGGNQDLTVFVLRQDGFKSDVEITVDGLPPGVTYKPQFVGPALKQGSIVLSAAPDAKPWAGMITVKGTALVDGKKAVREARPASITWPVPPGQNIPTITRLERGLALAVRDKAPYSLTCGIDHATVLLGDKVTIPLKLTRLWPEFKAQLQIQPVPTELPPGMAFGPVNIAPGKDDGQIVLNVPGNLPPGRYTFVFKSFAAIPVPGMGKGKATNVVQCSTAVVVHALPRQVATLTVTPPAPALKPGGETELTIKVARTNDFTGSFKVKLVLPKEVAGLSADEVTIPEGKSEVKLTVQAADDATPGPRNNLSVVATAVLEGVTLTHETKINVTINK